MAKVDDLIQEQIEGIDEAIEKLDKALEKYDTLREKRDRLRSARRALTGGTRLTGTGGTRIRQEDVVEWLRNNPGSTLASITEGVGGTSTQISSHLNRGKNERFLNFEGKWWVRDPKNGFTTEADCMQWLRHQAKEEHEDD